MSRFLRIALLSFATAFPLKALAAGDEIEVFFATCMASLPKFSNVGELAAPLAFVGSDGKNWIRGSDNLGINLVEAPDRYVCLLLSTGDHATRFTNALEEVLQEKFKDQFELKEYQGRKLYLVKVADENVIVEIVPPRGASTIVMANVRKQ